MDDLLPGGLQLTRVRKSAYVPHKLVIDSVRSRRSIVYVRFDLDALLPAIERCGADIFVAEHSHMAETFLRSTHFGVKTLVVNTINTESQVWRATRGLLGRLEWPRILHDELRVARAADAVGTYDAEEAEFYREHGVRAARWLDLTVDAFLATCRAPMAPIKTGGGVRAKLLDAASRGLPVVATSAAIGSLGPLFELISHDAQHRRTFEPSSRAPGGESADRAAVTDRRLAMAWLAQF